MMMMVELVDSMDDMERSQELLAILKFLLGGKTVGFSTVKCHCGTHAGLAVQQKHKPQCDDLDLLQ